MSHGTEGPLSNLNPAHHDLANWSVTASIGPVHLWLNVMMMSGLFLPKAIGISDKSPWRIRLENPSRATICLRVAVELSAKTGVELPIAHEVANILFEGKRPDQAVSDLMERELKAEHWR